MPPGATQRPAAVDALLSTRYRRGGGETPLAQWELSAGLRSWDDAPAAHLVYGTATAAAWQIF